MLDPFHAFVFSFLASSVAGLTWLLQSRKEITPRTFASAALAGGIGGCALTMMGWQWLGEERAYFLVAGPAFLNLVGISGKALSDRVTPVVLQTVLKDFSGRTKTDSDIRRAGPSGT